MGESQRRKELGVYPIKGMHPATAQEMIINANSLIVTVLPDGRVNVQGPLMKKEMCLKMLDIAAKVVVEWNARRDIIQATAVVEPENGGK